ncbi:murein transglycosylase [Amycolatopsis rhabdoformis]|uniref:Murein transglycosylase n=1 Tax=Amycolatopsis rhabdoformis TaxID=1448059 RepID=A0ABZ1I0A2_9PSEU|nr:murein transglycosylase [Amycolatopsis rhabdoformis]WSE27227.1 murein transglycosylase [Amycolatopsis rhabdoformis]
MADTAQSTSPPRRYVSRIALSLGLVLTGVVLVVTIGVRDPAPPPAVPVAAAPSSFSVPPQRPQSGGAAPRAGLAAPPDRPTESDQAELDAWATRVAGKTQLSARVLAAYGRAEMWMRRQKPACHLSWSTLAGIGHLATPSLTVSPAGDVAPPIIGAAVPGPDTDAGKLDGDRKADHELGPLHFTPATWAKYAERANGDGKPANPQNLDDAAFTAARYLCSGGDDLGTPSGWWRAMLFYNASVDYVQGVFSAADSYAAASVEQ